MTSPYRTTSTDLTRAHPDKKGRTSNSITTYASPHLGDASSPSTASSSLSAFFEPSQDVAYQEPDEFTVYNETAVGTPGTNMENKCTWRITELDLVLTMEVRPPFIHRRSFDVRRFRDFLLVVDDFLNIEAAHSGGSTKELPSGWRRTYRSGGFVMSIDLWERVLRARVRWSELKAMLTAMARCEQQMGYRESRYELYRPLVPRLPPRRPPVVFGYLTVTP
ncbi:MAG: hypothetical protein LQ342_003754 [Letrouitia transgressa]|nr:MAG: hypothetical protein LQ342_003754 [Letrouitia transgressa]